MTARQQALLGYLKAIRPELEGARDVNELSARIMRCVGEDAGFVAEGLAGVLAAAGRRILESRVDAGLGAFSRFVQDLVSKKR